jgi:hypothetical protein
VSDGNRSYTVRDTPSLRRVAEQIASLCT